MGERKGEGAAAGKEQAEPGAVLERLNWRLAWLHDALATQLLSGDPTADEQE